MLKLSRNTCITGLLTLITVLALPACTSGSTKPTKEEAKSGKMMAEPATAGAENSGYLGADVYPKLQAVDLAKDSKAKAKRWISPTLSSANYKSVLIEDVTLFPKPQAGPQVSQETLDAVKVYLTKELKSKIGKVLALAPEPGPQVLKMEAAVTGVTIKTEGMKAYEIIPVAAIFAGAKALTGNRAQDVTVFIEVKLTDSKTGEVLGAAVRKLEGEELKNKAAQLKLEDLQADLDTAASDGAQVFTQLFGQ